MIDNRGTGFSLFNTNGLSDLKGGKGSFILQEVSNGYVKPGSLNVYVVMPCPLKVPFNQLFQPFVEKRNADKSKVPVYWPQVTDCIPEGIEKVMTNATSSSQLPDVFVTSGYNILFNQTFYSRFLATGIMGGFPVSFYPEGYPQNLTDTAQRYHAGFLGYSSWGIVHNKSVADNYPLPKQWTDLVRPEYTGLLSIHGCHGHAGSLTMLLYLKKMSGEDAVERLAEKIFKVRHFAELIGEMGTKKPGTTPFYLMPYSAISNIPSTKNVEILELDGGLLTPMMMLVKQSKLDECKKLIEFFTEKAFKDILKRNAFFQPGQLPGIENYSFADMELLSEVYFSEANSLNDRFIRALGNKIDH